MEKLNLFNRLSLDEKSRYILNNGSFLCKRTYANRKVLLYYMENFYTEIWYDPKNSNIIAVLPFTTTRCLEPYLNIIELDLSFL